MIILHGPQIGQAMNLLLSHELRDLVGKRWSLISQGEFDLIDLSLLAIFEPGDDDADLQSGAGISLLTNNLNGASYSSPDYMPPVDYLHWATPDICEAIVCIGNSGYAVHVLIPTSAGMAPDLLGWCRQYAV